MSRKWPIKILTEYTVLVALILLALVVVLFNHENESLDLKLTSVERDYIAANPVILLGPDPDFAPVEFYKDGEFKGVVPDLVTYINETTDLNIKMIKYETWDD